MVLLKKLICDFGINDAEYVVRSKPRNFFCPYYQRWVGMVSRCYNPKYKIKRPTYQGCSVCEEWRYFSNFRKWVDEQPNRDWQNCQLDKDLILPDNKLYSPDTCVFIDVKLNSFILGKKVTQGKYLIGVNLDKERGLFVAHCCNPFVENKTQDLFLGRFKTEMEAHKAWQAKKHDYACQLAELQEDSRVADALRQRYAPDKDWTKE
jgi:hypothetical protein